MESELRNVMEEEMGRLEEEIRETGGGDGKTGGRR
jgi:hypothetical protein